MIVQRQGYRLSVSQDLCDVLENELAVLGAATPHFVVINFRDPTYSARTGGYHPVEIALDDQGRIQYVTDFAYAGFGDMAELVKELDFDFSLGLFQQSAMEFPIHRGRDLFRLWQSNFVSYYQSGVYAVSVTP